MQIVGWQAVNMKALQLKDIQYILCAEQQLNILYTCLYKPSKTDFCIIH